MYAKQRVFDNPHDDAVLFRAQPNHFSDVYQRNTCFECGDKQQQTPDQTTMCASCNTHHVTQQKATHPLQASKTLQRSIGVPTLLKIEAAGHITAGVIKIASAGFLFATGFGAPLGALALGSGVVSIIIGGLKLYRSHLLNRIKKEPENTASITAKINNVRLIEAGLGFINGLIQCIITLGIACIGAGVASLKLLRATIQKLTEDGSPKTKGIVKILSGILIVLEAIGSAATSILSMATLFGAKDVSFGEKEYNVKQAGASLKTETGDAETGARAVGLVDKTLGNATNLGAVAGTKGVRGVLTAKDGRKALKQARQDARRGAAQVREGERANDE